MKNILSEQYVCSCNQISNKIYKNYVINNQSLAFDEINNNLSVATSCGSCLLNAELLYLKLVNNNKITINNLKKNKYNNIFKRFKNLSFFSHYSDYFKKKYIYQTAPILSGKNITTDLIISNIVPKGFEKHTVPFMIKYRILNANGKVLSRDSYYLETNKRLTIPLNIKNEINKNHINADGSVWLKMIPLSAGYLGLTRPHIRVSAKNSINTIHLQHGRRKGTTFDTSFLNKNDVQYLSIINLENKNNNLKIKIKNNLKILKEVDIPIKSLESQCINLTKIYKMIEKNNDVYNQLEINHKGSLRRNLVIYNKSLEIISIDHI
tara:strand:+ start:218 stop:1183 length:966 start_codon:yes stop_codon:yes gene_type:complete